MAKARGHATAESEFQFCGERQRLFSTNHHRMYVFVMMRCFSMCEVRWGILVAPSSRLTLCFVRRLLGDSTDSRLAPWVFSDDETWHAAAKYSLRAGPCLGCSVCVWRARCEHEWRCVDMRRRHEIAKKNTVCSRLSKQQGGCAVMRTNDCHAHQR